MAALKFDYSMAADFIKETEFANIAPAVELAHQLLHERRGPGSEFTGWLNLPSEFSREELSRIKKTAERIKKTADVLIVIGIGGSYLGGRSALEALSHSFHNCLEAGRRGTPAIYFAGNNISSAYLAHLLDLVKDKDIFLNVISKSGTTLEPAIAFRLFRSHLEGKYGKEGAKERIIATTDREKGVLKEIADREGFETFVIPDDVGGRYSVLTAVGLLPMAAGGIDIDEVMKGAGEGMHLWHNSKLDDNEAYQYAAVRNLLYAKGKTTEVLVNYEPSYSYISEWWKQLFGESEGKDGKGIFPASLNFSTDLHSMGQYLQDGRRDLFATTLWVDKPAAELNIPDLPENDDGLGYLTGKSIYYVNEKACLATMQAHTAGGVPNLQIILPKMSPFYYGKLVYFFEKACAVSGYLLKVNPFDQPGVEAYKKKMFSYLGK